MISDSDGKNFPWYGGKTEVSSIKGPQINSTTHKVSMDDNFHPHITWDIPISNEKIPRLTNIKRNQTFYTWLAAINVVDSQFIVLKTFKWKMDLEIKIDPKKEQGKRAQLISNPVPEQPIELRENMRIPNCALYPSNANSSQVLMWRPDDSFPMAVVLPKCVILNHIESRKILLKNQNSWNSSIQ